MSCTVHISSQALYTLLNKAAVTTKPTRVNYTSTRSATHTCAPHVVWVNPFPSSRCWETSLNFPEPWTSFIFGRVTPYETRFWNGCKAQTAIYNFPWHVIASTPRSWIPSKMPHVLFSLAQSKSSGEAFRSPIIKIPTRFSKCPCVCVTSLYRSFEQRQFHGFDSALAWLLVNTRLKSMYFIQAGKQRPPSHGTGRPLLQTCCLTRWTNPWIIFRILWLSSCLGNRSVNIWQMSQSPLSSSAALETDMMTPWG